MFLLVPLLLGILLIVIDGTLMNVSMLNVAHDLNIGLSDMQALITFYSLITGAFMLLAGKLGDVYGRKKIFRIGVLLFGLGSLISALSTNGTMLFVGWSLLEGLGAALMMPASTSIIVSTFKGKKKDLAFGLWGATASVGAALGPIVGGFMTTYFSWRYAFLVQVFLAGIVLVTSSKLKESRPLKGQKIDIVGAVLSIVSITLIMYGILKGRELGWLISASGDGLSLAFLSLIFGVLIFIGFIWFELNKTSPLIELKIFKNKTFSSAILLTVAMNTAMAGVMFVFPIYFQVVFSLTALKTGLYLFPLTVGIFVASILGSKWRVSAKKTIVLGIVIIMLSLLGMRFYAVTSVLSFHRLAVVFVFFGIGLGFVMSKLTNVVMSSVESKWAGEASGVNSTIRRLASSAGTALVGTLFFSTLDKDLLLQKIYKNLNLPKTDIRILAEILKKIPHNETLLDWFNSAIINGIYKVLIFAVIMFIVVLVVALVSPIKLANTNKRFIKRH